MKSVLSEIQSKKRLYCIVSLAGTLLSVLTFVGIISYETNFAVMMLNIPFWLLAYIGALVVSIIITCIGNDSKKLIPLSITILIPLFFFISIDIKIPYFLPISGCLLLISWSLVVIFLTSPRKTIALSFFLLLLFSYIASVSGSIIMKNKFNVELQKTKATAQVVIDKIELYYQENATYPESIKDAGVTDDMMKLDYPFSHLNYTCYTNEYRLIFGDPLSSMDCWCYTPETKEWKLDD